MNTHLEPLNRFVQPMIGLTAWGVAQGYGSFLRFEFGQPELVIQDRKTKPGRMAYVRGAWHLWIYCCHWHIYDNGQELAWSEDDRAHIAQATGYLNGQNLVAIEPHTGNTRFTFDLGGSLETRPYEDRLDDQWLVFHDEQVFAYRGDGAYSLHPSNTLPADIVWSRNENL